MITKARVLDQSDLGQWGASLSRKPAIGGREQRAADSYESRLLDEGKQPQRESVAEWFFAHHDGDEPMRVLSLPDRHWSFENYLHNQRSVTFCGIQRDWKTLELSLPWMPNPNPSYRGGASYLHFRPGNTKQGTIKYAARGENVVVYMQAGDFMSTRIKRQLSNRFRSNTAIWIDLFGTLNLELQAIMNRLALHVAREKPRVPVVISFLASRDSFQNDEERAAAAIDGMLLANQGGSRVFKFGKMMKHKSAAMPYLSLFGSLELRTTETPPDGSLFDALEEAAPR